MKRDLVKIEPALEKLWRKVDGIEAEMDNSAGEGWTVLADLTKETAKDQ